MLKKLTILMSFIGFCIVFCFLQTRLSFDKKVVDNLVTFTRLLGYVRYFHPSDQADLTNEQWEQFALKGIKYIYDTNDGKELIEKLNNLFLTLAPTIKIFQTGLKVSELVNDLLNHHKAKEIIYWQHNGYTYDHRVFGKSSQKTRKLLNEKDLKLSDYSNGLNMDLPGNVSIKMPLVLYVDSNKALPHLNVMPNNLDVSESVIENNKAEQLTAIILAWNAIQHLFPYFDVIKIDWQKVLYETFEQTLNSKTEEEFLNVIKKMMAQLKDCHANAFIKKDQFQEPFIFPFGWDLIESKLIITFVDSNKKNKVNIGDSIIEIDSKPIEKIIDEESQLISGATKGWIKHKILDNLMIGLKDSELNFVFKRIDGKIYKEKIKRSKLLNENDSITELRPDALKQIKPGIFYIDLDRINFDQFKSALPELQKAKGIIFDMRGYPSYDRIPWDIIGHLSDKKLDSQKMFSSIITSPDHQNFQFTSCDWSIMPEEPFLKNAKIAFIIDGRAMSCAETWMGIIENYGLAEIIGEPTAGTTGEVNFFEVFGKYKFMWTGMKVIKHDGSQFHGVGIKPTIPVSRTQKGVIEGRDEMLEKAIEVVCK